MSLSDTFEASAYLGSGYEASPADGVSTKVIPHSFSVTSGASTFSSSASDLTLTRHLSGFS